MLWLYPPQWSSMGNSIIQEIECRSICTMCYGYIHPNGQVRTVGVSVLHSGWIGVKGYIKRLGQNVLCLDIFLFCFKCCWVSDVFSCQQGWLEGLGPGISDDVMCHFLANMFAFECVVAPAVMFSSAFVWWGIGWILNCKTKFVSDGDLDCPVCVQDLSTNPLRPIIQWSCWGRAQTVLPYSLWSLSVIGKWID